MVLYIKDGRKFFNERLLSCIEMANSIEVESILKNVDVRNLVDGYGKTLVHYAAMAGDEITMKYLVTRRGCQVNALDSFGYTPLVYAVETGRLPAVSMLLESNADILLCGQNQRSPLKMVFNPVWQGRQARIFTAFVKAFKQICSEDRKQMARILLEINCSLIEAMRLKDPVITGYMLDAGRDVNQFDSHGDWRPLHHAIDKNDLDHVKLLLERGADIGARDLEEATPLCYYHAGEGDRYQMLITLLNHDSSLEAFDIYDSDLVQPVFHYGQINEIEALLNYYDFDFSAPRRYNETLLHMLAANNHDGAMRLLEGKKFDVNATDVWGRTALWIAGIYCNPSTLEFLLKHGADVNAVNQEGWTILYESFANMQRERWRGKDYMDCLELLLEYGADVQHEIPGGETIFHIVLTDNQFAVIRPVIAQVAMIEASGRNIKEGILEILDGNERYKKFLMLCRKKIEKLQNTMINDTVTLFQFLIDSEEKLLLCARNHEAAAKLKKIVHRERRSKIFFVKHLRKRIENIDKIIKLREEAALNLSRVTGIGHQDVIEKIILLLDKPSLQTLGEI